MSYKNAIKLIRCLRDHEFVSVKNIIDKWPQSEFSELLSLIACVVTTFHERETEEDFSFNPEICKALMIATCESAECEDLWNIGLTDEVPIHFDNYKAFFCACKNGNLRMVKDFRRFQYDDEDLRNVIPDDIWMEGYKLAVNSSNKETADWIKNYLNNGTDEEESDFVESGDDDCGDFMDDDIEDAVAKTTDGGVDDDCDVDDTSIYDCDENCGEDCICKETKREIDMYNKIHAKVLEERKKKREDAELLTRIKNL
jgi:hypothetical protein